MLSGLLPVAKDHDANIIGVVGTQSDIGLALASAAGAITAPSSVATLMTAPVASVSPVPAPKEPITVDQGGGIQPRGKVVRESIGDGGQVAGILRRYRRACCRCWIAG